MPFGTERVREGQAPMTNVELAGAGVELPLVCRIRESEIGDDVELPGRCCPSWPRWGTASPTGPSSPASMACASGLRRWPQPARRSWSTGWPPGCSDPRAGPTRRCCTTPSATPTPPRAWRCRPFGVTCCGATGAGREAATSTSSSRCRDWARCWTPPGWPACWTGGSGGWPRGGSTGIRRSGAAAPRTRSATPNARSTGCRRGYARWWSR
jgi:hypothetical protein